MLYMCFNLFFKNYYHTFNIIKSICNQYNIEYHPDVYLCLRNKILYELPSVLYPLQ